MNSNFVKKFIKTSKNIHALQKKFKTRPMMKLQFTKIHKSLFFFFFSTHGSAWPCRFAAGKNKHTWGLMKIAVKKHPQVNIFSLYIVCCEEKNKILYLDFNESGSKERNYKKLLRDLFIQSIFCPWDGKCLVPELE